MQPEFELVRPEFELRSAQTKAARSCPKAGTKVLHCGCAKDSCFSLARGWAHLRNIFDTCKGPKATFSSTN